MISECARVTTAEESRYRVDYPNSRQRSVTVVALDEPSEHRVAEMARGRWNNASFLTASSFDAAPRKGAGFSMTGWLSDLAGRTKDLASEIEGADLVVVIATAGENAEAASLIGEACSLKGVSMTALIIGGASKTDEAWSRSLAQLRPLASMLVIASSDAYVGDMLAALRA